MQAMSGKLRLQKCRSTQHYLIPILLWLLLFPWQLGFVCKNEYLGVRHALHVTIFVHVHQRNIIASKRVAIEQESYEMTGLCQKQTLTCRTHLYIKLANCMLHDSAYYAKRKYL